MKKLFISQPMAGRSRAEIEKERQEVIDWLNNLARGRGEEQYEALPFVEEEPPETGCKDLWYLGKSLEIMSQADAGYFCWDWQGARGCWIEHECWGAYLRDKPLLKKPRRSIWEVVEGDWDEER